MFIYCFYRHVNHLNGNYVMKISRGGAGGECDRIDFAAKSVRKIRHGREDVGTVLNFQRHVITCKFIAFHSNGHFMEQHKAEDVTGCSTFRLAIIELAFIFVRKKNAFFPDKWRKMKIYFPCQEKIAI